MRRAGEGLVQGIVAVTEALAEAFAPALTRLVGAVENMDPAAKVFPVEGELLPLDPRRLK